MIKVFFITILTSMALLLATPQIAMAQGIDDEDANRACAAFNDTPNCADPASGGFDDVWSNIINVATFAVGIVAVLLILIGGLRYVLSGGDPQATASAKNTIIYAIVGLIVAIIARAIVVFVLSRI